MPVTIQFRGVCLFLMNGEQRVPRVLLPNAETITKPDDGEPPADGKPAMFADGTEAKKHWAGLFVQRGDDTVPLRIPLLGMEVRVQGGGDPPKVDDRHRLVPLNEVVNNGSARVTLRTREIAASGGRIAATVDLGGGKVDTSKPSEKPWKFTDRYHPGHGYDGLELPMPVMWTGDGETVTITVGAPGQTPVHRVPVGTDDTVIIYNYDSAEPTKQELTQRIPSQPGSPTRDHDFSWLYQLLVPPTGNWKDWLKAPDGFPVPQLASETSTTDRTIRPRTTRTSTCFGSGWDD